jgi:hypothetical protein
MKTDEEMRSLTALICFMTAVYFAARLLELI